VYLEGVVESLNGYGEQFTAPEDHALVCCCFSSVRPRGFFLLAFSIVRTFRYSKMDRLKQKNLQQTNRALAQMYPCCD
jgi:hypothetical protein